MNSVLREPVVPAVIGRGCESACVSRSQACDRQTVINSVREAAKRKKEETTHHSKTHDNTTEAESNRMRNHKR